MSHGTYENKSWHTCEWVRAHIYVCAIGCFVGDEESVTGLELSRFTRGRVLNRVSTRT